MDSLGFSEGSIIKAFGNGILSNFIDFYNSADDDTMKSILNASNIYLQDIWNEIGKLIFSWGCGQDRSLANT